MGVKLNGGNTRRIIKTKKMIKEYVPYDIAVALIELGFSDKCLGYYELGGLDGEWHLRRPQCVPYEDESIVPAPLWQQAFEFFRGKGLHAEPVWDYPPLTTDEDVLSDLDIEDEVKWMFVITAIGYCGDDMEDPTEWMDTYEEARASGLQIMIDMVLDYKKKVKDE